MEGDNLRGPADRVKQGGLVKDAKAYPIDLESEKIQFLEEMVTKYRLADAGKAVRCLINYARENPDKQREIFEEVRCVDC